MRSLLVAVACSLVVAGAAQARTAGSFPSVPSESWRVDDSYGVAGVASVNIGTKPVQFGTLYHYIQPIWRIATQPDGGVLVMLRENLIYRVTPSGSMDMAFGKDGRIAVAGGNPGRIQTDGQGRIYVAEQRIDYTRCTPYQTTCYPTITSRIKRFTAAGAVDTSYGAAGTAAPFFDAIEALRVLPEGTVALTSVFRAAPCPGELAPAFSRVRADGTLDSSVGINGFQALCDGTSTRDLSRNSDGSFLLQSTLIDGVQRVQRLTPNGAIDIAYGTAGTAAAPPTMRNTLLLSDGTFVAVDAGKVIRVTAQGQLDGGFGPVPVTSPTIAPPGSQYSPLQPLAAASNGTFYLQLEAGLNHQAVITAAPHLIYRVTAAGALDASWGSGGVYTSSFHLDPASVAVLPAGELLLPRSVTFERLPDLLKLSAGGAPVATFGAGGVATIVAREDSADCAVIAEPQSTGAIVVSGSSDAEQAGNVVGFVLTRFTPAGALDASFGQSGTLRVPSRPALPGYGWPLGVTTVLSDDKIAYFDGTRLLRFQSNGAPDTTFGANASGGLTVTTPVSVVRSLSGDSAGRLTVMGEIYAFTDDSQGKISVSRYSPSGTLDTGFGVAGELAFPTTSRSTVESITTERNGQVAALIRERLAADVVTTLRVWNAAGQPDPGFGANGVFTVSVLPILPAERTQTTVPYYQWRPSLTRLSNGAWLVTNVSVNAGSNYYYPGNSVIRVTATGQWDTGYGVNGVANLGDGSSVWLVDDTGRAYFINNLNGVNALNIHYRADATGRVDRAFGAGGRNLFPVPLQGFGLDPNQSGYRAGNPPTLHVPDCSTGDLAVRKLTLQNFTLYRTHLPIAAQNSNQYYPPPPPPPVPVQPVPTSTPVVVVTAGP
jgi:uncharacterized delta-60 repeat protein